MSKIFAWFSQYKWVLVSGAFLAACAMSWNISSKVSENEYNSERIKLLNQTIEAQKANDKLKDEITRTLKESMELSQEKIKAANRAAINEILTDPRYRTCTITNGVRNAYRDAISAQSASRGNNGKVPATQGTPVR